MKHVARFAAFGLIAGVSALGGYPAIAHAGQVRVDCASPGANGKINTALARLDPQANNVVTVKGTCVENVVIRGFDRLTLNGNSGATIRAADSSRAAVEIVDSQSVVVRGFTVQGGTTGLFCRDFSFCRFIDDTVEDSTGSAGVMVASSQGRLTNLVVRNVVGQGIAVVSANVVGENISVDGVTGTGIYFMNSRWSASPVTIQRTQGNGIDAGVSSQIQILAPLTVSSAGGNGVGLGGSSSLFTNSMTITGSGGAGLVLSGNASATSYSANVSDNQGVGIASTSTSSVSVAGGTVANNQGGGITVQYGSTANLANLTVTNNALYGVQIDQVSYAQIGSSVFTGHSVADVNCGPQVAQVNFGPDVQLNSPVGTNCPLPPASAPSRIRR